jgi:hypothetical protein
MASHEVRQAWRVLLIESEFARNYPIAYQLDAGAAARNPVLEKILPSLLHIKMAAVLDEALETHLAATNTSLPKTYRPTLDGRISFFDDSRQIANGVDLHAIRQRRNDLAHDTSSAISWAQLDQDLDAVNATFQYLGFVGPRPHFEIKAERSAMQGSQEPGVAGYFDYSVSLIEGERTAAEFKWRSTLYGDEAT